MNSIAVDPPFTDTKTRKTTIKREMNLRRVDDSTLTYLDVVFTCNDDEVNNFITEKLIKKTGVCKKIKTSMNGEEALLYLTKSSTKFKQKNFYMI